jgi:hypothetical protein
LSSQIERGELVAIGVSNQPGNDFGEVVHRAAMTGMLDLADIFQLIHHCFHHRPLAQQQLVKQRDEAVFHILFDACDQLQAAAKELLEQILADVALVAHEFAKQFFGEFGHRGAVADIAGGEADAEQFTLVIDQQMQLESIEPTDVLPRAARPAITLWLLIRML